MHEDAHSGAFADYHPDGASPPTRVRRGDTVLYREMRTGRRVPATVLGFHDRTADLERAEGPVMPKVGHGPGPGQWLERETVQ